VIWLARAAWLVAAALAVLNLTLNSIFPGVFRAVDANETTGLALYATISLIGIGYATAGLLILRQRPRHVVGWMLLATGPLIIAEFTAIAVGYGLFQRDHPAAPWFILLSQYGWVPAFLLAGPILATYFPDGRLPNPRWRLFVRAVLAYMTLGFVAIALRPGSLDPENGLPPNPLGVEFIPRPILDIIEVSGGAVFLALLLMGVVAIVYRFRRARGEERQQLKWFAFAVIVWGLVLPPSLFIESNEYFIVAIATLLLVPASVVIAISRYRLYEIDTLINRTLVYVLLVGVVAGLYAASVALFQRVFVAATGDTSDAAAIISALLLAAVFTPIRKSIEAIVDRRFKPTPSDTAHAPASSAQWDDPAFEAAVERVVRRVLRE
jgi:hypothetical protein